MPGQRSLEGFNFLTPRAVYREGVTAVDPETISDPSIPILDTRYAPNRGVSDVPLSNAYGQDARIVLAVLLQGFDSVSFEVWLKASVDTIKGQTGDTTGSVSSSSSASAVPEAEEWVFVEEHTATRSELWTVKDIPPGLYKVQVVAVTGDSGSVSLREQHAA